MKYKFLVAVTKGENKNWIKVKNSEGTEFWCDASKVVCEYAKKNCKKDTEYEFQTEEKNGKTIITRVGSGDYKPAQTAPKAEPKTAEYKCKDCGKVLKDNKYEKCYECNQKAPTVTGTSGKSESIEKQCCMKAASGAIATVMQGQVSDIDTLAEMITKLYEKLYKKLTE